MMFAHPPVHHHVHHHHCGHRCKVVRPYRGWLHKVAVCESDDRPSTNTGNGFYGAFQFTIRSWRAVGGRGWPHHASMLEQSYRAVLLLRVQGTRAWPVCG